MVGSRKHFVIAIDGPAGSGKTTTARLVARRLKFRHLDTGAMYRALTLKCIEQEQDLSDKRGLERLLRNTRVEIRWRRETGDVLLDGRNVSAEIREPMVSGLVSELSVIPMVRRVMVREQRRVAASCDVVCEGRDIGSVVFPDAQLKVYLDCDLNQRALRRQLELGGLRKGVATASVRRNLKRRDRIDSSRTVGPLRRVPGAILVDTANLSIEDQVAVVCELAMRRGAARGLLRAKWESRATRKG